MSHHYMTGQKFSKANGLFDFTIDWDPIDYTYGNRPVFRHSVRANREGFLQLDGHRITPAEIKIMIKMMTDALAYIEKKPRQEDV